MDEKILIKKYTNRRLYDTEKSRYITLAEVKDMICADRTIQVVDVNTKEDVTAYIMTQIILEEARKKKALLPVSLLHLIIKYGDNVLSEFFESYLQQILGRYLQQKAAFDEQFIKILDLGIGFSEKAWKNMTGRTSFNSFRDFVSGDKKEDSGDK